MSPQAPLIAETPEQVAVAPESQMVTQVISMDRAAQLVHLHSNIRLDQMQSEFKNHNAFELPVINSERTYDIVLPDTGKVIKKPLSIDVENEGIYGYAWLTSESLQKPQFKGYVIVTKNSPGAYNKQGERIPDRYFGGRDYIMVGASYLCFCLSSYKQGWKESGQELALEHLRSFMPDQVSANVVEDGQRMGGVVTQDHTIYDSEEFLENKLPEKGSKKK